MKEKKRQNKDNKKVNPTKRHFFSLKLLTHEFQMNTVQWLWHWKQCIHYQSFSPWLINGNEGMCGGMICWRSFIVDRWGGRWPGLPHLHNEVSLRQSVSLIGGGRKSKGRKWGCKLRCCQSSKAFLIPTASWLPPGSLVLTGTFSIFLLQLCWSNLAQQMTGW